jgi:hypothetical protein
VPNSEKISDILTIIQVYEDDDEVCDSPLLVAESGLDREEVDAVLEYLWREDRIECRRMRAVDGNQMLTGIRRVVEGRKRRWGQFGRYQDHP